MKALLIPVKDSINAKSRLAGLMSLEERRRLARAMFEDVSRAVAGALKPDRIVMVTSFASAIERARELGWDVLIEESQVSESASVDWASRMLAKRGFEVVMRLPADLPLVRAEDIDALLSVGLDSQGALIVPSRDGTGTNSMIRTPTNPLLSRSDRRMRNAFTIVSPSCGTSSTMWRSSVVLISSSSPSSSTRAVINARRPDSMSTSPVKSPGRCMRTSRSSPLECSTIAIAPFTTT